MSIRKRRCITPEFNAAVVRLVTSGARTVAQAVKDLDLTESAVRAWIKHAEVDAGDVRVEIVGKMTGRMERY